jgi:Tfp pilus assembly protein PilN
MIRINLLAERKGARDAAAAGPAITVGGDGPGGTLQNLVLAALLIAVIVGFGGFAFWVKSRVTHLEKDIRTADAELARLAEIRKKMDEYTKQKDLLERKVNLITQLKKNQQVPVHLLDQISRNLPDFLWLDNMRQDPNNHLVITGKATTYNAVADFYNRLIQSGWFLNVTQGRVNEVPEGVSFTITGDFAAGKIQDSDVPAATAAASAGTEGQGHS